MKPKPKQAKKSAKKAVNAKATGGTPEGRSNKRFKATVKNKTQAHAEKAAAKKAPPANSRVEAAARRKSPSRKALINVPPLLLEGDTSPISEVKRTGPGQRYVLGAVSPGEHWPAMGAWKDLPESYGTRRFFLTARDPNWLYASWDLTREQLLEYNRLSSSGHLIIRTYINSVAGEPLLETHVHPESRSWFIHVGHGGTRYMAELGYRGENVEWHTIARSTATLTPPDRLSEDVSVRFATLPPEVKFEKVIDVVRELIPENVPLIEAIQQLRAGGSAEIPELPAIAVATPPVEAEWTPAQTEALAKVIAMDNARRVWVGSLEITELVRHRLQEEISSITAAQLARGGAEAPAAVVSSPFGAAKPERRRAFWFNVNAELVIYGATERDAMLTIAGRNVALRSDGTFSFRFALPDGEYELPITAAAPDGEERRSATLSFRRSTRFDGDVGAHPQDSHLKTPMPANVA
jgi:uncharacterized protein